MLDAAADLMRTRGIAGTTTKEIAKAAGFSEAALYKHFRDKATLLLSVLRERMPAADAMFPQPSDGELRANLLAIARGTLVFYVEAYPMFASLMAEPDLLTAHRDSLRKYDAGPAHAVTRVADYLRAEQALGRVSADADPDATAALLIGACFQNAFFVFYEGTPLADPDRIVAPLVDAALPGLQGGSRPSRAAGQGIDPPDTA